MADDEAQDGADGRVEDAGQGNDLEQLRGDRHANGRFAPGHHFGQGKPRGSRSKLGEAFLKDVLAHWEANGAAALVKICEEKPLEYVRMIAGILPKEVKMQVNELDELSDEQIGIQLTAVLVELAELGMDFRPDAEAARQPQPARRLSTLS